MAAQELSAAKRAGLAEGRRSMIEDIDRHFRATRGMTGIDGMRDGLRLALERVPRDRFVPERVRDMAYADSALPIGHGQTISQPFIVALSIELARVDPGTKVLEIGTGSGYEAAVLSEMGAEVYSIELIRELSESASRTLEARGYESVALRCGDGYAGWPEAAPFDAIIVTACAPEVPEPLLAQLAPGGRLVAPVGSPNAYQELQIHVKDPNGHLRVAHSLPVAFVPFIHEELGEG